MEISKVFNKVILISTFVLLLFMIHTTSNASGKFSASASKTTVTVGDTFTITVSASGAAGTYEVSANNSNVSVQSGDTSGFIDGSSSSITYKANSAGTVTITAKATDMTDLEDDTKQVTGSKTFTITVKEKSDTKTNTTKNDNKNTNTNTDKNTTKPSNTTDDKKVTFSKSSGTVYASDDINLRGSATTKEKNILKSLDKGTKMTIMEKSNGKIDGYSWYKVSVDGTTGYVATSLVTTKKPADKPTLSALTVSPGSLSPAFAKGTTTYNVSVESDVEEITVKATGASGATAKVTCKGTTVSNGVVPINEGLNTINVQVSKDGETNTYTLYVRRSIEEDSEGNIKDDENSDEDLFLKSLEVEGFELSPEFDKDTYSYTVEIPADDDTTSLDIEATANDKEAEVEIIDNEDFEYGENIVTIMVKSKDGSGDKTYQIIVNKLQEGEVGSTESVNGNTETPMQKRSIIADNKVPVILICILLAIAITCLVLLIRSGKKEDDFEKQLEEDEESKDILDTEVPEEAYESNQYLNELRQKENDKSNYENEDEEMEKDAKKARKGKHF